ncbi:MAG TPA: TA system VapC family ribonuclease toxin [Nakamurella sp.]
MIVDANLLLYARNTADERHDQAREWLESSLNGTTRVGLPWWSLAAFLRIGTNPRAYPNPLTPDEAGRQVEEWLDAPRAWLAEPTANFRRVFTDLVRTHGVRGPLTTDAQLAALALDHGVSLASTDADFARFREVNWIDPLASRR